MNSDQKLISFDLKAEMGFFKKPDINDGIYLTYNMLHKPALLGILGAIIGLKGYENKGMLPDYYTQLEHLKIAIQPLDSDKGNFQKEIISYNNGTGFASTEAGGNLIITEQVLLHPAFRCFLLLNLENETENKLYENLWSYQSEYVPYMGKNEFGAWWTSTKVYTEVKPFGFDRNYSIASLFMKNEAVSQYVAKSLSLAGMEQRNSVFLYFERLPIGFDTTLHQYEYGDFVYSNAHFKADMELKGTGDFYDIGGETIIQLR